MITGKLEKRLYLIGGKPELVVYGDISEAIEVVGLRYTSTCQEMQHEETVNIFILGGKSAETAPIKIPYKVFSVFSGQDIFITSDKSCSYGEWYGKVRTVTDLRHKRAIISIPGLRHLNKDFVSHVIFRPVLDRLLFECGYIPFHASGVAYAETGCIITGTAGSGKSTVLFGLLKSGMGFLGDDRISIRKEGKSIPVIHAYPEYIRLPLTRSGPKHMLCPPGSAIYTSSPKLVLFLEKGDSDAKFTVEPITPAEAGARLMHCIPPAIEKQVYKKAFSLVGDLCQKTKNFLITGWGNPQERLKSILWMIKNYEICKLNDYAFNN